MSHFRHITILLLSLVSRPANAQKDGGLAITVTPLFNGQKLVLNTQKYTGPNGDTLQFERLRFYLSGFELVFADGTVFKENGSYHLIDAEEQSTLTFTISAAPRGKLSAIRFSIGVDSLKSVSGAWEGDLDPRHGMYWAWNSGYINAKLEGKSPGCKTRHNRFEFHIGGYAYPQNALRHVSLAITQAQNGNTLLLLANIESWLKGIDLGKMPNVMIPGKEAMHVADNYSNMFSIAPAP